MTEIVVEIVGWAAALLILASYALLSSGRLSATGAAGFIVNSGWNGAYPSAALNVAWAAIGLATLWRVARGPAR
jgi:hypothetical protein